MAAVTVLDQFTGRSINKFTIHKTQQFEGYRWREIKINNVVILTVHSHSRFVSLFL